MAQDGKLQCRTDEGFCERVERYRQREGLEHRSDAVERLLKIGLREQRNPLIWRAKNRVVEWANMLVVAAVVVAALGATTHLYPAAQGVLAGVVLLVSASLLLAALEVARGLAGANPMGARVRQLVGEVAGDE